ncbi:prolipoprotein diacylglyceryl transferase [Lentilactobacillus parakefiri]|uniref:Gram-positive cocci surface proteins LPxTG domain-containing protein n=1 Tax=Lentilactobacillus parakefiri TaxID=152332 RepID=A0A269YC61_9LACO|nr:hypothetical protein [Lentilactobacillus parakefiri]PAK83123.1 hypothetical protein B8W98_07100 [Lentilactobacillus parakefiri]
MNIKVKYRLTLLFSLMVFGGLGMNTQVNAASDDSTVATVQVQSVSKTDSAASVNPAEGTSSNVSAEESSNRTAANVGDSKAKENSSSVTTTYGDAKDNQVKPNSGNDKDDSESTTVDSSTDASQQLSAQKESSSDNKTNDESASSVVDPAVDADVDTPDVTDDSDSSKASKPVIDKAAVDADKSSTADQETPAASDGAADNSAAVDASKSGQPQETLAGINQPIIESTHIHNDIVGDTFADHVTKSDPKAIKEVTAIANNKTKLLTFNAFSDKIYRHVLKTAQKPGTVTTTTGHKVTLTTPVKHVKYTEHDSTGISETLPVMATLVIIGVAGITFIAFDPLRFLFK